MEVASSRSARTQTNPVSNIAPTPTPTNNSRQRRKHIRIIQNDNTTATTATALASNVEIVDLCAMDEGEFAPVPVSPQSERRRRRRQRQRQRKRQKTHQAGKNRQDEDVIVLDWVLCQTLVSISPPAPATWTRVQDEERKGHILHIIHHEYFWDDETLLGSLLSTKTYNFAATCIDRIVQRKS